MITQADLKLLALATQRVTERLKADPVASVADAFEAVTDELLSLHQIVPTIPAE